MIKRNNSLVVLTMFRSFSLFALMLILYPAIGFSLPEDVARHALSLVGKGVYVQSGNSFIVSNFPGTPAFLLNGFETLFSNWSRLDAKEYRLLREVAEKDYQEGKLSMNCWGFVLLVLLENKMLTQEDIEKLYFHDDQKRFGDRWVNLWGQHAHRDSPKVGDVALFFSRPNFSPLYHVAIVTSVNPLQVTEIFGDSISTRLITQKEQETLLFIDSTLATQLIKDLPPVEVKLANKQKEIKKGDFESFCSEVVFKDEIEAKIDDLYQQWRAINNQSAENYLDPEAVEFYRKWSRVPIEDAYWEKLLRDELRKKEQHESKAQNEVLKKHGH
ncbi:MAG: CHAP domain-containing protein [Oligoflexia bacterium]|nr:CHAP domain-containing protein [Oligoflexia bacterium]